MTTKKMIEEKVCSKCYKSFDAPTMCPVCLKRVVEFAKLEERARIMEMLPEVEEPPTDRWKEYGKGYNTCLAEVKAILLNNNTEI